MKKQRHATGPCAYCGTVGPQTDEHLLATSLLSTSPHEVIVSPALGHHRLGQQLTTRDVCADCNNGPLSRLDAFAARWMECAPPEAHSAAASRTLLRWRAKYACNASRTMDKEPHAPPPGGLHAWVIERGDVLGFHAAVTWIGPSHPAARGFSYSTAKHWAYNGLVHVREWLFVLAWSHPDEENDVVSRMRKIVQGLPSQELTGHGPVNPRLVPRIRDASWVDKSYTEHPVMADLQEVHRRQMQREHPSAAPKYE